MPIQLGIERPGTEEFENESMGEEVRDPPRRKIVPPRYVQAPLLLTLKRRVFDLMWCILLCVLAMRDTYQRPRTSKCVMTFQQKVSPRRSSVETTLVEQRLLENLQGSLPRRGMGPTLMIPRHEPKQEAVIFSGIVPTESPDYSGLDDVW